MPTTISHLKIKGFRSLKDVEIELGAFSVLIGANGAGKSNLIEFFQMTSAMFTGTSGTLQNYVARKGRASSIFHYGPQVTPVIDTSLRIASGEESFEYEFSLERGATDELFYSSEYLHSIAGDAMLTRLFHDGGPLESNVLRFAEQHDDDGQIPVAKSLRKVLSGIRIFHFHDTSEDANMRVSQDLNGEDGLLSNGGNLAAFLYRLKEKRPAHYRRILDTVQYIAPYIADIVVEPDALNDRFVMLRWRDRSGTLFGPHQLSDGTLRTIALITALLQPDETMPSIMLFDEPELGLHPQGIRIVAELLKAVTEKRQVIVATQSPLLIRNYDPADIAVVEREEDAEGRGSTVIKRLDPLALEGWLEEYDLGQLYEKNVTGGGPQ